MNLTLYGELRGQPSVRLMFFSPPALSGHITKTAKLADCQPNAPEVAQISVIPFSPGSSSLTF